MISLKVLRKGECFANFLKSYTVMKTSTGNKYILFWMLVNAFKNVDRDKLLTRAIKCKIWINV